MILPDKFVFGKVAATRERCVWWRFAAFISLYSHSRDHPHKRVRAIRFESRLRALAVHTFVQKYDSWLPMIAGTIPLNDSQREIATEMIS